MTRLGRHLRFNPGKVNCLQQQLLELEKYRQKCVNDQEDNNIDVIDNLK